MPSCEKEAVCAVKTTRLRSSCPRNEIGDKSRGNPATTRVYDRRDEWTPPRELS